MKGAPQTQKHRWWVALPLVLGLAILIIMVKRKSGPEQKPVTEPQRTVRTVPLLQTQLTPIAEGYGTVEPSRTWQAFAEVPGKIVFLNPELEEGALLAQGTVLAEIDPSEFKLGVLGRKAQRDALLAQRRELELETGNLQDSLTLERRNLRLMEKDLERYVAMAASGSASETLLERAERDAVRQRLQIQSLDNKLALMPLKQTQLDAQLEQAEASLQDAERRLRLTKIIVPFDCRITQKKVEQAQAVQPGILLASADSLDAAEIKASFTLEHVANLMEKARALFDEHAQQPDMQIIQELGLTAQVHLKTAALAASWEAQVTRFDAHLDPNTRTAGIFVEVKDPYRQARTGVRPPLVRGMFCQVVLAGKPRQAKVIAREALHGDRIYVVNEESRLEVHTVKVRSGQFGLVEIETDLPPGTPIVISDLAPAVTGMLLVPKQDQAKIDQLEQWALNQETQP